MSSNDPGGGGGGSGGGQQDISSLQENFNRQQAKISALKELVRKSEAAHGKSTSSTQEKVKNIAQRLTHLKSKARSRQNPDRSLSELRDDPIIEESQQSPRSEASSHGHTKARSETPGSEKFQLLRKQMEENKLKMAERENSKREIEELVTQLKAKFDSTQASLERSSELGRSMGDLSVLSPAPAKDKFKSATDLTFTPLNLDKERIKFLENRIRLLEKQAEKQTHTSTVDSESEKIKILESKILDLEENLKEKECIIEARTQAVSLMSESLSAKGKNTVDMLEDTRQEMFKMQSSFIETEDTLRADILHLREELKEKCSKIKNLEEVNDILETARFDLTIKNAELESKIQDVQEYSTKLSELNKLNESLQHRIADLESQKYEIITAEEVDVAKQVGTEYANNMQSLKDKIKELETENDYLKKLAQTSQTEPDTEGAVSDKVKSLDATIAAEREEIEKQQLRIQELEELVTEKTIECNVLNANFSVLQEKLKASAPKSLFSKSTDEEAEHEINKLKTQLDDANKSMIKTKLKMKQLQKQVDSFKKMSDVNGEVIRLTEENQQIQQRIAELEDEKGSLQLKLISGDSGTIDDSELEKKIHILETTCQNQTSAIQLLEEQKLDMTENLHTAKHELESLKDHMHEIDKEETARVVSQMESVQLEEKVGDYITQIDDLKNEIEKYKKENENLHEDLNRLDEEKNDLMKKIDHYVAENMELLDKVEKLSKSSSSAESIEIVERLTQQEKLEMEAFNKKLSEDPAIDTETQSNIPVLEAEHNEMGQELSDSLIKLREESSELMHRIELFTTERREVLDKMEVLNSENQEYLKQIADLNAEKSLVEESFAKMKSEVEGLESKLVSVSNERDVLLKDIKEITEHRDMIKAEMAKFENEKQSMPSSDPETIELCEKSLSRMFTELENYRKSNDKGGKLSTSKKLAKEARNAHQQLDELVKKLKSSCDAEKQVKSETNVAVEELKNKCSDLEKVIDNLKVELNSSRESLNEKNVEIEQLKSDVLQLASKSDLIERNAATKALCANDDISHLQDINKELEAKLETSDKEIEILRTLVAEQKQQLIESYTEHENEITAKLEEIKGYEEEIDRLKTELDTIQSDNSRTQSTYAEGMKEETKKLENALSTNKKLLEDQSEELRHKQDTIETLNSQIMDLYKTMEENANKVIEKDDEIVYLQEVLDSNRKELERHRKESSENKTVTEKLLVELHSHTKNLEQLESLSHVQEQAHTLEARVKQLEKQNAELDTKNKEQLDKLKKFAANLKKKVAQCMELEKKLKSSEKDNVEMSHDSTDHAETINLLQTDLNKYRDEAESLRASFDKEVENLSIQVEQFKAENNALQMQLNASTDNCNRLAADRIEYQNALAELFECKTRIEIFEREKCELQSVINTSQTDASTKHDQILTLQKELETALLKITENDAKFTTMSEDLKTKNLKFEKCKAVIKEKNREIQRLNAENQSLQSKMQEQSEKPAEINSNLEAEYKKLKEDNAEIIAQYESEKEAFQQTISRLETLHDGIQAKLQEDMGYIESLETENNKFKEKIFKLENCVASFEERRASLERQTNLLDAQLQKRADEYEKNEDALIYRLNMLSDHDDVLGRRLLEKQEENEELSEKLDRLKMENTDLNLQLSKIEKELEVFKTEKYEVLESEKQSLQEQFDALQLDLTRQQNIYEGKLSSKHAEIDDLENELSVQLQRVNQEKRTLQENLEKSGDEVIELKDENVRLKENSNSLEQIKNDLEREITWIRMQNENLSQDQYELQELRMQIIHDKSEIENQKHQLETLAQNHETELNALKQQIAELDSMRMQVGQNQTDDQVFIETENKRLKDLLVERDAAIESYQRENLKLQMVSLAAGPADPFSSFSGAASHPQTDDNQKEHLELNAMREKVQKLETEIVQLQAVISEKDVLYGKSMEDQNNIRLELHQANTGNSELQKMYFDKQNEVTALKTELEKQSKPATQDITSHFAPPTSTASFFDDVVQVKHMESLQSENKEQKKIEDLERNVSDLEKYVTDLEHKLKNLTTLHEETLLQLQSKTQQYEESMKNYEERIKTLEADKNVLEVQKSVESLIVSEPVKAEVPSLHMFFDSTVQQPAVEFDRMIQQPSDGGPVVEEIIVPKKAYLCYPDGGATAEAIVPDESEGWGWGSEEAALEEKHQKSTVAQDYAILPPAQNLELKLQEYQDRVQELELERNRLDEKVIELQVKSGKMMKRLKEYKLKIDQQEKSFRKSSSVESNDLDLAIQEELKSQVTKLEDMVSTMKEQHTKELAEKNNLLKRIDVLTSANDRMTEMKERQDIEVEMYQTKVRQLNQQLQQLGDWGEQNETVSRVTTVDTAPPATSSSSDLERTLTDTQRELEDIKVDRDELQALLDDEKNNLRLNESKIKELQDKIVAMENKTADEANKQNETLRSQLVQKETDLNNMILKNQNLHLQLSDYQLTIEQLSTESNSIKSQLDQIRSDHQQKVSENENLSKELDSWIKKSNELSHEIECMRNDSKCSEDTSQDMTVMEEKLQELHAQLQYKDAEIMYLKKTVEDTIREDQTQSLVQEMLVKTQEINQLRQQVQTLQAEKIDLENNLSLQLTRDMTNKTDDTESLQRKIQSLEQHLQEVKSEKEHMENELQVLNNHVLASLENEDTMKQTVLELDTKNIEISELKKSLELMKQQQNAPVPTESSTQLNTNQEQIIEQLNAQWKDTVEQRCTDIAESWRQHLTNREQEFQNIESNLLQEIEKLRNGPITTPPIQSSSSIESSVSSTDVDLETIQKMQSALESQELEIVTLKEQLAMRSAEYARLASRHDPYAMSTSSNISFDSTKQRKLSSGITETPAVSKTDLDLALYMLHQRDMRCEELTLELVNLLEERDTLQLKLSNSLRQVEDIKRKTGYLESGSESDQSPSNPASPERMRTRSTGTGSEDDSLKQSDNLNSKISQIHAVSHTKDKRLWEEREQRQRQMEKIQQDVANIPSQAVSELVGADLTNTAQRPSTVLLNWLWGNPSANNPQS